MIDRKRCGRRRCLYTLNGGLENCPSALVWQVQCSAKLREEACDVLPIAGLVATLTFGAGGARTA